MVSRRRLWSGSPTEIHIWPSHNRLSRSKAVRSIQPRHDKPVTDLTPWFFYFAAILFPIYRSDPVDLATVTLPSPTQMGVGSCVACIRPSSSRTSTRTQVTSKTETQTACRAHKYATLGTVGVARWNLCLRFYAYALGGRLVDPDTIRGLNNAIVVLTKQIGRAGPQYSVFSRCIRYLLNDRHSPANEWPIIRQTQKKRHLM